MSQSKKDLSGIDLEEHEVQKVADHFNKHIGDRKCHICGESEWSALDSIYTPDVFDRKRNSHRRDYVLPTVVVCCKNCGTLTHFSAGIVGIPHKINISKKEEG